MSDADAPIKQEAKQEKRRKLIKWVFWRIPIALMIIGAILIGALKIVEGYPDPLRQGFEQYLSEATGRNATIGTLEEIKFFPNFIVHAKNITVHNLQNAAIIDLEIEDIKINAPFSTVFLGSKKINDLSLVNLKANKDMFGPHAVEIESAGIVVKDGPEQFGSFLVADGLYGARPASFEAQLDFGKYNYRIPSKINFSTKISDYGVSASLKRNLRNVTIENTVLSVADKRSQEKSYVFSKNKNYNQDNPLTCIFTQENLQNCDKYLSVEPNEVEN